MAIDRTKPGDVLDANTIYFDAGLRHQIGVRNFTSGQVNEFLELFEKADQAFTRTLREQLKGLKNIKVNELDEKLTLILASINSSRNTLMSEFRTRFRSQLIDLGQIESDFEERLILQSLPFEPSLNKVSPVLFGAIVREKPFSSGTDTSRLLNKWLSGLATNDKQKIREAIQLGLLQGDDVNTIIRRVVGTSSARFRDGILGLTRRNAEVLIRTGINSVSNAAREAFWNANATLIKALRWTATLDGRTTHICQARDGKFAATLGNTLPIGLPALDPQGARPPAHPNCRSVMLAAFDQDGIVDLLGNRPFVRTTLTGRKRQIDFRAQTKANFTQTEWSNFTVQERNARIRSTKVAWSKENIGQVTAVITYDEWLRRQPTKFQDEVLGQKRAIKFRAGTNVDRFIDRQGNTLTLKQLAAKGI